SRRRRLLRARTLSALRASARTARAPRRRSCAHSAFTWLLRRRGTISLCARRGRSLAVDQCIVAAVLRRPLYRSRCPPGDRFRARAPAFAPRPRSRGDRGHDRRPLPRRGRARLCWRSAPAAGALPLLCDAARLPFVLRICGTWCAATDRAPRRRRRDRTVAFTGVARRPDRDRRLLLR